MITFKQVSKRYPGGHEALKSVDFTLQDKEMVFLTGHSGAGKSTLLKLIALLDRPTGGQIIVNNKALGDIKKKEVPHYRKTLGITFQSPHLIADQSIFDNVGLPLKIQGFSSSTLQKRVDTALDMVGLLHKKHSLPAHLSGGEQQRAGIARAVVHKPDILLADEPTGNLDPDMSADVMRLFEQFNQAGVAVLVATHDLALIASMRHRIVMLRDGQIC